MGHAKKGRYGQKPPKKLNLLADQQFSKKHKEKVNFLFGVHKKITLKPKLSVYSTKPEKGHNMEFCT